MVLHVRDFWVCTKWLGVGCAEVRLRVPAYLLALPASYACTRLSPCPQARLEGQRLLQRALCGDAELNMDGVMAAMDCLKQAAVLTREADVENEARALSALGRVHHKVLKNRARAGAYYTQAVQLANSLAPRCFTAHESGACQVVPDSGAVALRPHPNSHPQSPSREACAPVGVGAPGAGAIRHVGVRRVTVLHGGRRYSRAVQPGQHTMLVYNTGSYVCRRGSRVVLQQQQVPLWSCRPAGALPAWRRRRHWRTRFF